MRRASSRSCRPTNQASCGETRTRCCAAEAAVESVQGARRRRVPVRGRVGAGRRHRGDVAVRFVQGRRRQGKRFRLSAGNAGVQLQPDFCRYSETNLQSLLCSRRRSPLPTSPGCRGAPDLNLQLHPGSIRFYVE